MILYFIVGIGMTVLLILGLVTIAQKVKHILIYTYKYHFVLQNLHIIHLNLNQKIFHARNLMVVLLFN